MLSIAPMPRAVAPGPALVLGRSVVLGAAGFGSGVVSHVAGGGRLPGGSGLVLLLGLSIVVASFFLRTRASASLLVALVLAAQSAVHLVLSVLAGHDTAPPLAPGGEGVVAQQLTHLGDQGAAMVLTHTLGALALALFLAWGESALWRLLDLVSAEVSRTLVAGRLVAAVARHHVPRCAACVSHGPQVFHPLRLARATTRRRGPPLLLAA